MKPTYLTAILGGLTIGIIPAWIVSKIAQVFPSLAPQELEEISHFFDGGLGPIQLIFFFIIVFLVPPLEEKVFRDWIWRLFNWKLDSFWTWMVVSILFAAVHAEPLHIIGLLPLSFFLGWLRLRSGGIGLPSVAHMSNNAVGCVLMML